MKALTLAGILLLSTATINAQNDYQDALSHANYAYSHTKNAHESNNRDHVVEHSDKAIEAFYEVEELADKCGCEGAYNAALDGREAAEKTATQDTWERSRFYAKRARAYGEKMVSLLNECNPLGRSNTALVSNDDDISTLIDIEAQRAELLEKKNMLAMEQKRLEAQIAIQKEKQAEFESQLQQLADL